MKRIAWMGPLNISKASAGESVSAYCSDQLLNRLRQSYEIDLYCNGVDAYHDFPTYHYLSAAGRHAQDPYDLFVYQIEDDAGTDFVRMHLALIPGLVWFHDVLFTRHGPEPMKNSPWSAVLERLNCSDRWWDSDYEFPARGALAERELSFAGVAAFSSARAHHEARQVLCKGLNFLCNGANARSFLLPLPLESQAPLSSNRNSSVLRIAYCGSPRIEHRAHKILWALQAPELNNVSMEWLVADSEFGAAQALLSEPGFASASSRVIVHKGRSAETWSQLVGTCDLAMHPLFSAYGHPGLYLAISQRAGVPCVVSRFGDTDYLGEEIAFKVDVGEGESKAYGEIFAQLSELNSGKDDTIRSLGRVGRVFAQEQHDSDVVAAEFKMVIDQAIAMMVPVTKRWRTLEMDARAEILRHSRELVVRGDPLMNAHFDELMGKTFQEFGWR